jgi:hypothetical protein
MNDKAWVVCDELNCEIGRLIGQNEELPWGWYQREGEFFCREHADYWRTLDAEEAEAKAEWEAAV